MQKHVTIEAHKVMIMQPEGLTEEQEKQINAALDGIDIGFQLRQALETRFHQDPALKALRVESEQVE